MQHILSEIIFLPILGAMLILLTPKEAKQSLRYVAMLTTLLTFILSCVLAAEFKKNDPSMQFLESYSWISTFNISYLIGVDGLSLSFIVLTALLFLLSMIASWNQVTGAKGYFALFLLLESTILGTFAAQDLFLFFTFWMAALLPVYFLVSIWGNKNRDYASTKFFLYQMAGSALILISMFAIYYMASPHTFDLLSLSGGKFTTASIEIGDRSLSFEHLIFVLMLIGFAVRLPVVPFHTWFSHIQSEAPSALAVILAAVFIKTGAYALVRINYALFPTAIPWISGVLAGAGVINIIYGAFCALGQKDIRRLVAYSCVSHMGFVLLGIAIFSSAAFHGALLHMIAHGVYAGLLFFLVGIIGERSNRFTIVDENGEPGFGGLVARAPLLTGFFIVAVFSALGIPGLGGFASESLVFLGTFPHRRGLAILGLFGVFLTAGYFLWMFRKVFLGQGNTYTALVTDLTLREKLFLTPLVLLCVVAGTYPAPLINIAQPTINQILTNLQQGVK